MREEKIAGLRVRLCGGEDRQGGGDGPLVVLMHGFGAPGTDLVDLWRTIGASPEVRFAFPEAPLGLGALGYGDGRAWWMIDITRLQLALQQGTARELAREVPPGLDEARKHVVEMLDVLERSYDAPSARVVLGGFSQGAMLACDVVFRERRDFAGLVVLSGALIAEDEWAALMPEREGLPVLQSHGRADPILPYAGGVLLREMMIEAGLEVEWVEFNGGHGIPPGVLERLAALVARTTGDVR